MSQEWIIASVVGVAVALVGLLITAGTLIFKSGKWVQKLESDGNACQTLIETVQKDIAQIHADIKNIFSRLPPETVAGTSPLHLTDLGMEMSKEISAKEWMAEVSKDLVDKVTEMAPFEVQELSFRHIKDTMREMLEQDTRVLECSYNHGAPKEKVLDVLAVELRDHLLRETGQKPDSV